MTGLTYSGWAASKALKKAIKTEDFRAYDLWFRRAVKAADELARKLHVSTHCAECGDAIVPPVTRARCNACRAVGGPEGMRRRRAA